MYKNIVQRIEILSKKNLWNFDFRLQYLYIYFIINFLYMLTNLKKDLDKAVFHLKSEFSKLQVGRANPALVEWVLIDAYGTTQPLKNIAAVSNLDGQTLTIQPWDKTLIHDIEKGISNANIGLNPTNNGENLLIKIPPLTEDRRREITKTAQKMEEDAKISTRNIRAEYKKKIDKAKSEKEITEDEAKNLETQLQKSIDAIIKEIEQITKDKEADIMKV